MTSGVDCPARIAEDTLIAYWLDELDEAADARIDEHLLGCDACSRRLAEIVALADGTRVAFEGGEVRAFVTDAFVRRVATRMARVREYRVPHNGSVNCSVGPEDDLLVAHLEAPLAGVHRVDAISYLDDARTGVFEDIPFDAATGEVVMAPKIAHVRLAPSHRMRVELLAVDERGRRMIGHYTFNHVAQDVL
jgi:anti-sigma factor RsiW